MDCTSQLSNGFFVLDNKIPYKRLHALCVCSCGKEFLARKIALKKGTVKGCPGCSYRKRNEAALSEFLGKRFGRWTVTGFAGVRGEFRFYEVKCDCGTVSSVCGADLKRGGSTKCPTCRQKEIASSHGRTGTKEYSVWMNLKQRCKNPNSAQFKYYGGRGISLDIRWEKFENFYSDMGNAPSNSHQIHRVNNDKGYSKDNCIWIHETDHGRLHNEGIKNTKKISKKNIEIVAKRDLVGKKFNKWTIIKDPTEVGGYVLCQCQCGLEKLVWRANVVSGKSTGCTHCGNRKKRKP